MPTATASFDDAFDFDEPARKKAPRKPRSAAPRAGGTGKSSARVKAKKRRLLPSIDMRRVTRWGAIGMSGSLAVAIMVNALILQKGHHPAPLFGKAIALGPTPMPAAKPAPVERAAPDVDMPAAPPPATRQAMDVPPAPAGGTDAIGQLIEGKAPPAAAPKVEKATVVGAQRALAKLGFALKPSGTFGPQTRKAIEAFERDRHLPVKGELTHRLVKVLAAESGLKID